MKQLKILFLLIAALISFQCNDDDVEQLDINDPIVDPGESVVPTTDPTSDEVPPAAMNLLNELNDDSRVMMQAFYWDCEPVGSWWDLVSAKLDDWSDIGVDRIWVPAPGKGAGGQFSMGYDPYDYFDLGEYDQKGAVETRFGSRAELEAMIAKAHSVGIDVIADIVLNHNSGGDEQEVHPITGESNYTKFTPASGRFFRTWEDFHPNNLQEFDEGALFFAETDLSHVVANVSLNLWAGDDSVAKWYKNTIGFDGWRFDYVKGFPAWAVEAFVDATDGAWSVGENFDGNTDVVADWVDATNGRSKAFDFPMFYKMEQAFDGGDLNRLAEDMYWKRDAFNSVTFVSNHDTEKDPEPGNVISNKGLAYAYMLTHEGYPTLFYLDYEHEVAMSKEEMRRLVLIHNSIAFGTTDILHVDNNEYVARRNGDQSNGEPGLVVYLNLSDGEKTIEVDTNWDNTVIVDYAQNDLSEITTDGSGMATITVPAKSYTIWAPQSW
ncbi:MAG: alpha-amylase [Saprospiraceae bacterium]|nr:alpha-amylase [Saprospiraceae bacterium]